jgi:hypothetical protein
MTLNRVDFSTRKPLKMLPVGLMVEVVAVSAPACGGSKAGATPAAPVVKAKADNITMIGKIEAGKGPIGAFTSKQHWPAMAPSDLTFTIAALGINVPLTKAPTGGVWTTGVHLQGRQGQQLFLELHDPPAAAGPTR